jgi:hypothetical protein
MIHVRPLLLAMFLANPVVAQETGSEPASTAQTTAAADAPVAKQPIRVRWGVSGALGYFLPAKAVDFGVSGRIGVQLGDHFGAYADIGYVPGIGLGASSSGTGGSISISAIGFFHFTPMAEFDLGPFFVAGGPILASGGWGQIEESADSNGNVSQFVVAAGGFLPGFDVRTGFTFGSVKPNGKRSGFTLGFDLKLINAQVSSVSQSGGPNGASQTIQTGDRIWGFTPMLMLGYESK